jgi:hypothetical protein
MIPNKPYDLSIFTQESSYRVDAFALDRFIADVYSIDSFEGTLESDNDTTHEFTVTNLTDKWHDDEMKKILVDQNCECWKLHTVLDDMCSMDIIPPGKYYVRVCW